MKSIFTIAAAILVGLSACKKEDNKNNYSNGGVNGGTGTVTIAGLFGNQEVKSKSVGVSMATGGSFYGPSGSRFEFQPNSFITRAGVPVTGVVTVEVKDWVNKGDMLFSRMLPVSNGQPLLSGGEFSLRATQNGQELLVAPGTYFSVHMPQHGNTTTGMKFFLGQTPGANGNNVNWIAADSMQIGAIVYNGDTISIFTDSVGYCNADKFMSAPNYQSFQVKINGVTVDGGAVLEAYALYDGYKGVWKMNGSSNTISENHVPDIPVHFVVMVVKNGKLYGGITGAIPSGGSIYTVNVAEVDANAFAAQVRALP